MTATGPVEEAPAASLKGGPPIAVVVGKDTVANAILGRDSVQPPVQVARSCHSPADGVGKTWGTIPHETGRSRS